METDVPPLRSPPSSAGAPCWSDVLQNKASPKPQQEAVPSRVFGSCGSGKGVAVAVVDANAIVHGDKLTSSADRFVSVKEVLEEVRDPVSRQRLAFLPFPIETMEPPPDAIKKVVKFARETGDLQTLSDVDIKLIALTYMLEAQIHGTDHLRSCPPPLHMVNVRKLPETEMPGWGSNVPNLAEWEALEQAEEGEGSNFGSRILPLKDINFNAVPVQEAVSKAEVQERGDQFSCKPKRSVPLKKEIKIDGKKMVADGIDASQGEDRDNVDDWLPAVSRTTHRRYLRRKARRMLSEESEKLSQPDVEASTVATIVESNDILSDGGSGLVESAVHRDPGESHIVPETLKEDEVKEVDIGDGDISSGIEKMALEQKNLDTTSAAIGPDDSMMGDASVSDVEIAFEGVEVETCRRALENIEISSQTDGSIDAPLDDNSSEQSWTIRSLSESSVACVTSDFAMQNVILQIGLRLLAPGGMQIRQLHRWVLKCHACNKVTTEIGRIFCPKCGNGGTLRKVSVTVGENGIVLAARRPRITLRGTKFSIPMPEGGRDAICRNLILREDQVPHKLLYPKSRKKNSNQDEDFFSVDDIFSQNADKRSSFKPPVGKAVSVFTGKRNPNDNHFSRRKH